MQGLSNLIPAATKVAYLRLLLKCGFDTLDCGSFVNPSAVPQMADTAEVLTALGDELSGTKLLVIVANERGAVRAAAFPQVRYIGYPFSVNETFQRRNTNSGKQDAFMRLLTIRDIAMASGKEVVAYISMAFGNPYGEPHERQEVLDWAHKMATEGIRIISLADTVGSAEETDIRYLFSSMAQQLPEVETGAHFHARPGEWLQKIQPAWESGCSRFDGAILGFGGCPFAKDDLTGNVPTELMLSWLNEQTSTGMQTEALQQAVLMAPTVYNAH